MRVDGDSMKDAGILHGDLLVVDRAVEPVTGRVVVVNGEHTVKRLRKTGNAVWIDPANDAYKPIRVMHGDTLRIFGVVRHTIHTLR